MLDFITETCEQIDSAEAGLLELESKPGDKDVINQIFRGFHTINGLCCFLNLTQIGQLAHSAENLLNLTRKGEVNLTGENIDIIFETIDMLKMLIADLETALKTGKPAPVQQSLSQLLEKFKATEENQNLTDSLESPLVQEKDRKLEKVLDEKDEPKKEEVITQVQARSGDEKIKVSTARLDNLVNMVGELVVAQLMVSEEVNTTRASEHNLCRKIAHQSKIIRDLQ